MTEQNVHELTEERIRQIVREELAKQQARRIKSLDGNQGTKDSALAEIINLLGAAILN